MQVKKKHFFHSSIHPGVAPLTYALREKIENVTKTCEKLQIREFSSEMILWQQFLDSLRGRPEMTSL